MSAPSKETSSTSTGSAGGSWTNGAAPKVDVSTPLSSNSDLTAKSFSGSTYAVLDLLTVLLQIEFPPNHLYLRALSTLERG